MYHLGDCVCVCVCVCVSATMVGDASGMNMCRAEEGRQSATKMLRREERVWRRRREVGERGCRWCMCVLCMHSTLSQSSQCMSEVKSHIRREGVSECGDVTDSPSHPLDLSGLRAM